VCKMRSKKMIIIHGGAGEWNLPNKVLDDTEAEMKEAVSVGLKALKSGSAIESVIEAVSYMEGSGKFNAGRGAYPNIEYDIELDAGVMDGKSLGVGAVACVRNVPNPVRLAYKIMKETKHVLIVGEGAERIARGYGLYVPFDVAASKKDLIEQRMQLYVKKQSWIKSLPVRYRLKENSDTIGAVALDGNGDLAAATSTGGTAFKLPGRVGDSPIPGAGFYAVNGKGAVSATGEGEDIMRYCLSLKVVENLGDARDPFRVLARELGEMKRVFRRGSAGAIALDHRGRGGVNATTKAMAFAAGSSIDEIFSKVTESVDLEKAQEMLMKVLQ
jgi:beta-aspartyl-peptidase (threonine type)